MASRQLDPGVTSGRDGHDVGLTDAQRIEQLRECVSLRLRRATDRNRRVVVAGTGGFDDGKPVLGQPLVPEVGVTRGVAALEDEDWPGPCPPVFDRSTARPSDGSATHFPDTNIDALLNPTDPLQRRLPPTVSGVD
jgi:hypothetical protein